MRHVSVTWTVLVATWRGTPIVRACAGTNAVKTVARTMDVRRVYTRELPTEVVKNAYACRNLRAVTRLGMPPVCCSATFAVEAVCLTAVEQANCRVVMPAPARIVCVPRTPLVVMSRGMRPAPISVRNVVRIVVHPAASQALFPVAMAVNVRKLYVLKTQGAVRSHGTSVAQYFVLRQVRIAAMQGVNQVQNPVVTGVCVKDVCVTRIHHAASREGSGRQRALSYAWPAVNPVRKMDAPLRPLRVVTGAVVKRVFASRTPCAAMRSGMRVV